MSTEIDFLWTNFFKNSLRRKALARKIESVNGTMVYTTHRTRIYKKKVLKTSLHFSEVLLINGDS